MSEAPRKKSPRAPSMSLDEALERTGKAYDKERLHAAPTDVVAQNIGYRGANNGSALAALASLRYYGLLERPREGVLAVAKDYENYRFAPDDGVRRALTQKFFRTPPLFRELLEQYESGFPSDATLKYELIQRGFLPAAAATLVGVLRRSAEFAGSQQIAEIRAPAATDVSDDIMSDVVSQEAPIQQLASSTVGTPISAVFTGGESEAAHDRIPVRLTGNRRAWLVIPDPFYEADKKRLKAQIDLLLTEDDEDEL